MKLRSSQRASLAFAALTFILFNACQTNKNLQPENALGTQAGGFDVADSNHDGKLSRNEASDFLVNEIFTARDMNHDGRMTQKEWTGGNAAPVADFTKRDANHDGTVTRDEAIKYGRAHGIANKFIAEADKNDDGKLSRKEVQAYYASHEGPAR